jgi:hypothetical protein
MRNCQAVEAEIRLASHRQTMPRAENAVGYTGKNIPSVNQMLFRSVNLYVENISFK